MISAPAVPSQELEVCVYLFEKDCPAFASMGAVSQTIDLRMGLNGVSTFQQMIRYFIRNLNTDQLTPAPVLRAERCTLLRK